MDPANGLVHLTLAALLATSYGWRHHDSLPLPINLVLPSGGSDGQLVEGVSCESWRFVVETNDKRNWTVPRSCAKYVGRYMLGGQYWKDSAAVVSEAIAYAESLVLKGDGKDVWIFDIDETSLSNLPCYALFDFGSEKINYTLVYEWMMLGIAPVLPESLRLYKKLASLGIKVVFLTGRNETMKSATVLNLRRRGYHTWEKLLLRQKGSSSSALIFKSAERQKLVDEGYIIIGNIGDQWSDITGVPEGNRTFKLPNPMYYIG